MTAEHVQHHGITLGDGRVLMATGLGAGRIAEVDDPATDTWTASAMIHDRYTPLLGPLANGRVMVAGGTDGGAYAELYDPDTNEWTSAGVMHRARPSWRNGQRHEMVLLSSDPDEFADDPAVCGDHCGKLLVAGNTVTRVSELYTPAPEVTAVSPDCAPAAGGEVTITGFAFSGATEVLFGDRPATDMTVMSSTEIVATPPGDASGILDVIVTTPGGTSVANEEAQAAADAAPGGDQPDRATEGSFNTCTSIWMSRTLRCTEPYRTLLVMTKSARLDVRLEPEDEFVIRRAAQAAGMSVSSFVVASARMEAAHVLAERTVFVLEPNEWAQLQQRLAEPATLNSPLQALFDEPDIFE